MKVIKPSGEGFIVGEIMVFVATTLQAVHFYLAALRQFLI